MGDPPKKSYGNMFQNFFKELFVDISNTYLLLVISLRNYEVTPGVCPRPIPQEICLANLSLKTPGVVSATKKNISSNLTKISRPKAKIFWGISPKTPHLF